MRKFMAVLFVPNEPSLIMRSDMPEKVQEMCQHFSHVIPELGKLSHK